ncbi:A-kinase anchor protein SPHKAP isoform X2 [Polypterus senegalus]|uniref:A-kinase anchor protein SPHKAP isoform X2 n=1 Tax=Polypterus senegalus TaxID=55291 RepID=UPI0019657414|nr:A-kinase anchor protein SPHKAP isoform X2 [Polypterus senegalus]
MASKKHLLAVPSNFGTVPMFETSDKLDEFSRSREEDSDRTLQNSVSACKKVLCSKSLLESTEYWLRNEKDLCRIGFTEDKTDCSSCTAVCFVNLDSDYEDFSHGDITKELASVSPDLPKLMDSLNLHQPKENEIVLLSRFDSSENGLQDSSDQQGFQSADICLVQCAKGNKKSNPNCLIYEINKFLIGLETGQARQLEIDRYGHSRPEDDTNRSVSSIEEDFLTASEHLDEESEEDNFRNEPENIDGMDLHSDIRRAAKERQDSQQHKQTSPCGSLDAAVLERVTGNTDSKKKQQQHHLSSLDNQEATKVSSDPKKMCENVPHGHSGEKSGNRALQNRAGCESFAKQSRGAHSDTQSTQRSAGYYATNLAESVLQDAFIKLSQAEPTFTTEAALSISSERQSMLIGTSEELKPNRAWNELPKIVIVQSPDTTENTQDWPGAPPSNTGSWSGVETAQCHSLEDRTKSGVCLNSGHPVEMALACAATVVGTISSPQVTEKLKLEQHSVELNAELEKSSGEDEEEEEEEEDEAEDDTDQGEMKNVDFSFSSALCGMARVAGAIAIVGLDESKTDENYSPSCGLLSAAETPTSITLHCSIKVGSKIEQFTSNIADVLLKEACLVLTKPNEYKSLGDFLESIQNKIVDSIAKPKNVQREDLEVDSFSQILSDVIFKHSVEKANRKKSQRNQNNDMGDIINPQAILLECTNDLLFNVLHHTCKKISAFAMQNSVSLNMAEDSSSSASNDTVGEQNPHLLHSTLHPQESGKENIDGSPHCRLATTQSGMEKTVDREEKTTMKEAETGSEVQCKREVSPGVKDQQRASQVSAARELPNIQASKQSSKDFDIPFETPYVIQHSQEDMFPHGAISLEKIKSYLPGETELKLSSLTLQQPLIAPVPTVLIKPLSENWSPVTVFADDLATTVVSMATEMAAIYLENSNGKQPWFCAWKTGPDCSENYLMPCRTVKRKKEAQVANASVTKKHRPPRLSEIKKKTEEQPELKERLMNRVVDESMNLDEPPDPFALFASEVTAKILNCPEFSVVDTSKQSQSLPRNRLHCDRWNRGGKTSSYESIPEEDGDSSNPNNTLGPGSRLGQNLSRGSSISKQSSCESITDEFSRFMVNQMENEGRGFELLLDYYAEKHANNILSSAIQQVTKKNGHLNVRSACVSKQSSTESITEEFYKFMLKEMDKENKDSSVAKARDWSSRLLSPSSRTPFCFRQSSMPDRRSSDSRLTVNTPMKANSFDGFARNAHADHLNIYPVNTVSSSGLCKSDSCLYQRGRTDQITDMLIHETWSSSIESLMRKNKIIVDEDMDFEQPVNGSQPHVEHFANRLAADIVEGGKSLVTVPHESLVGRHATPLSEKRQCFRSMTEHHTKHSTLDKSKHSQERKSSISTDSSCITSSRRCSREVPLIHIETDQREEVIEDAMPHGTLSVYSGTLKAECYPEAKSTDPSGQGNAEYPPSNERSTLCYKALTSVVADKEHAVEESQNHLSCSDESTGSWSQITGEEEPPEDTSSYLQLSEGNGNSSTSSSLGLIELEVFPEITAPCIIISEKDEADVQKDKLENLDECTSGLSVGTSTSNKDLLILNFDMESKCVNSELRTTLQWIAASELGVPTIYFKKSQEKDIEKFLSVVRFIHQKEWNVGDLFHAVVQYCKVQERNEDSASSLFDWLLEFR